MPARETRAAAAAGIALLLLLLGPEGCRTSDARPSLLLILIDTLRSDHLGFYGYARPTSPTLDTLAARGVVFERAITASPWTLPAAMSLLTGRLASSHRVENDGMKLSPSIPLLPEVLQKAGYATAAVVSHIYVSRPFGFHRGFDHFDDFGLSQEYRFEAGLEPRASAVTDRALARLHEMRGRPFFLLVHYFDPHWDYDAPAPFKTRFTGPYRGPLTGSYQSFSAYIRPGARLSPEDRQHLLDLYDGEIAYTDSEIGRLLEGLRREGLSGSTVVAVTSDHGEEFKEHDSMGHGRNLYDEVLRIPLLVTDPRRGGPLRRARETVQSIDLFPTLCGLAGVAVPPGVQGRSLAPWLAGRSAPGRPAVSETIRFDAYRKAYREGAEKLIVSLEDNRRELYDLAADPAETRNLWSERGDRALALEQALFAEVDVFSGGWNLRWSSDGTPHAFSGTIETEGMITQLVPLFPEAGRHRVIRGKRIDFDLQRVRRGGGLSFTLDPPEARVGFALAVDGKESVGTIRVGGAGTAPPGVPFSFAGALRSELFSRPVYRAGGEVGFFLWKSVGRSPEDTVELDEAMKERLRALGYLQ